MMVIVSAAKFEVQPLLTALATHGIAFDYVECGVGALYAAGSGEANRHRCAGKEVLHITTCGVFSAFTDVELVRGKTIRWLPTCERLGLSYSPGAIVPPNAPDTVDRTPPLELVSSSYYTLLPTRDVVCAPNVSRTNALPAGYENCVENIETYPFLRVVSPLAKSVDVILGVTNAVGENAHREWQNNHQRAAILTAAFVLRQRFNLAPLGF